MGKAWREVNKPIKDKALFTFIEIQLTYSGSPSTNKAIESVNTQIREILKNHCGMPLMHYVKTILWWCLMDTENSPTTAEILRIMSTDDEVAGFLLTLPPPQRKMMADLLNMVM